MLLFCMYIKMSEWMGAFVCVCMCAHARACTFVYVYMCLHAIFD